MRLPPRLFLHPRPRYAHAREQFNLDQVFTVYELCALPNHTGAMSTLTIAALKDTAEGQVGGRLFLPYEEPVDSIAGTNDGSALNEQDDHRMFARPLSPTVTHDDIRAIFSAPGAIYRPIDDF